jgi:hypothetical protein
MQYSTLQEAYNIDCLKPAKKNNKSTSQASNNNTNSNNHNNNHNNQNLYNIENNSLASNKEAVNYNNSSGGSCSPIQAPTYNIPISGDCKKERDAAMKTYIEENFKTESIKTGNGNASSSSTSEATTVGGNGNKNTVNSGDTNVFTNRQDNIMPFYDEDMEQYFDINNLTDEVKYNSGDGTKIYNYMPNHNKNSYTNNNTGEYSSNNNSKNGVNLLNTNEYNLSSEERKKAQEALEYLKIIEDKINKTESSAQNDTLDSIIRRSNNTGPGGFGDSRNSKTFDMIRNETQNDTQNDKDNIIKRNIENENKLLESIKENKKTENIFNMIINIFIFIFIGAFIILICDYITELAIQIGSTRTSNILEPYIKYNIYMQHHFQHLHNMATNNNISHLPQYAPFQQGSVYQGTGMPGMPNVPSVPGALGVHNSV